MLGARGRCGDCVRLARVTSPDRALFVSDCHLGAGTPEEDAARQDRLVTFLETEAASASSLFLLGDLFDFWFEYRHAVPRGHFRVLAAIRRLVERGIPVTFVGGNHDFWADTYLEREIGCRVHRDAVEITLQGRRLFLAHGDGLMAGDRGYLFLKSVLRHPLAISAYRWIHPDVGIPFAHVVSRLSRGHRDESRFDPEGLIARIAVPRYARGIDGVVLGHFHVPTLISREGKDFVVLGDWIARNCYAALENGKFTLYRWEESRAVPLVS
jgi:UDP-2,3-diacylglucosamine hydrolase